jgi:hypothetical protein
MQVFASLSMIEQSRQTKTKGEAVSFGISTRDVRKITHAQSRARCQRSKSCTRRRVHRRGRSGFQTCWFRCKEETVSHCEGALKEKSPPERCVRDGGAEKGSIGAGRAGKVT